MMRCGRLGMILSIDFVRNISLNISFRKIDTAEPGNVGRRQISETV